jgi:uncharacterized membrane protein YphA (DoxX/SURF4 family)
MPGFATLWLNWEPRMLSILRIMVGLLYMEHGLAKILDFPHQPNCKNRSKPAPDFGRKRQVISAESGR